jgi:hypothetical protein
MDGEIRKNMCNAVGLAMEMERQKYLESILQSQKSIIKTDVDSGLEKSVSHYLDRALTQLKQEYKNGKSWSRFSVWPSENVKDVVQIWESIKPEVLEGINGYLKQYRSQKMTREIRATSAQAVIAEAMKDAGLKHKFIAQVHRAKVLVLIGGNSCITFHVLYSRLMQDLPRIIDSLKIINEQVENIGSKVLFAKAYGYDNWI